MPNNNTLSCQSLKSDANSLFCVHTKKLWMAGVYITHTVNTHVYSRQQRMPLSLLAADKPASKGTDRRDFRIPICSSEPTEWNLPQISWTVKRPSAA